MRTEGVAGADDVDGRRVAAAAGLEPRRFAYADPPYPGLARLYYDCDEIDHVALIARLCREWPDGWALSTSARALRFVLALCPPETRVCPWFRGARPNRRARRPGNAWEPLLVCGGRETVGRVEDVLVLGVTSRSRSHPDALIGMKPPGFCAWLFRLLGAQPQDELADLFPGSGAVSRAWEVFRRAGAAAGDTSARARHDTTAIAAHDTSRRASPADATLAPAELRARLLSLVDEADPCDS